MSGETGHVAIMEEIGGLLAHAEQAQAALDKGLAAQAENAETITRLIRHTSGILKKLQAEAEQIGARADQAAAAAAREQARESLSGMGAIVGKAAGALFTPLMGDLATRIREARRAATLLDQQAARFSNRALAVVAAGAVGALALIGLGIWALLSWQRAELANLAIQKADLQGEIEGMKATAQKMQAQGLKIEFNTCLEADGRRQRLCVAVAPGTKRWGTDQAPFAILKGY